MQRLNANTNVMEGGGHNPTSKRGLMVQAPMGTGKSWYLKNRVPLEYSDLVVDGDDLLEKRGVKNRNYFWYDPTKSAERDAILKVFREALANGKIILYSGSPTLIPTDVLVVPDAEVRWERLTNRSDFRPKREQFEREQREYEEAKAEAKAEAKNSDKITHVFDEIPDVEALLKIMNQN